MVQRRTPVIIDTDPGVDDVLALLFALASPEIEIIAIIVSYGNTDIEASYLNILKTYYWLDRHFQEYPEDLARFPNFPTDDDKKPYLLRGASRPLEGEIHSAQYFHGRDGLGDISRNHPELNLPEDFDSKNSKYFRLSDRSAEECAIELIRSYPERAISYVVLGPMTNLASILRQERRIVLDKIGLVIAMGGALDVPGNTSPTAEFNFFADPFAVHDLLTPDNPKTGLPLNRFLLIPLDITTPHELLFHSYIHQVDPHFSSPGHLYRLKDKPPLHHFTSSFLERTREVMLRFGKDALELHDVVAIWCASSIPPEDGAANLSLAIGWEAQRRKFQVERYGEITRGMLVVDKRPDEVYGRGANRAKAQADLDKAEFPNNADTELSSNLDVPVPVQVESPEDIIPDSSDIWVITKTPGFQLLPQLMMSRIWRV